MGFRRSVPWASQPQVAPQFAQYWLDRGLQCVTVGKQAWVRGSGGWVNAAPGTVQTTKEGQAAHDLVVSNADYQKIPQGAEQSVFALAQPGGNLTNYTSVINGNGFTLANRGGIEIGVFDGSFLWYFVCRSNTFQSNETLVTTGVSASAGVLVKLCYRSSAIGTPYHSLSVDEGAATVGTTFAAVGANSTDTMTIGATSAGGGTMAVPLFARFNVALTDAEFASLRRNPWQLFTPLTRSLGGITGTISRPGTDVSVAGWSFTAASLSASINEATRDDASYGQAPYGVAGAITTLDLPLVAGSYTLSFAGQYLAANASSGQFRFTALDSSNTSLGVSAWTAVTSSAALYTVALTVSGGTATRLKIEIQA